MKITGLSTRRLPHTNQKMRSMSLLCLVTRVEFCSLFRVWNSTRFVASIFTSFCSSKSSTLCLHFRLVASFPKNRRVFNLNKKLRKLEQLNKRPKLVKLLKTILITGQGIIVRGPITTTKKNLAFHVKCVGIYSPFRALDFMRFVVFEIIDFFNGFS